MLSIYRAVIGAGLFLFAGGTAFAEDWRIFGAHGTIQMTPKGGNPVSVSNDNSHKIAVPDGSSLQIKGKGKLVLVSLTSRRAFELGDNSYALIDGGTVRALSGTVTPRSGFAPPKGKDGKMGGVVMRGPGNPRSCLKALSPINTAILETMPELRWKNSCNGLNSVGLSILSDNRVVHKADVVSRSSYRVPANVLGPGRQYLWILNGGPGFDISSGVFSLPTVREREEVLQRIQESNSPRSLEDWIALVYFLSDRGFMELANEESLKLRVAFPEPTGLSESP